MRSLLLCLFSALFVSAHAQVFMRPFDPAAIMAMGGAGVAYPGLEAGIQNEAAAGMVDRRPGIFLNSTIPYGITDWQSARIQAVVGLDKNSGAGLEMAHSGLAEYREQLYRLFYGRRLGERLYLGGSADLLRVSAQEYGAATGMSFGIGILANALPGLWIGAHIQNPVQQKIGDETTSSLLRIGAAWKTSTILTLIAETEKALEKPVQIKAGLEYRPVEILVVRAGVRAGRTARMGFGAGLRFKNGLALDTAAEWHPSLGLTPSASIIWRKP